MKKLIIVIVMFLLALPTSYAEELDVLELQGTDLQIHMDDVEASDDWTDDEIVFEANDVWSADAIAGDIRELDLGISEMQRAQNGSDIASRTLSNTDGDIAIDALHFPDAIFREYVSRVVDIGGDGILTEEERNNVLSIDVRNNRVSDLSGIQYFPYLQTLICYNNIIRSIDVSMLDHLTELSCSYNDIHSLKLNESLKYLDCFVNGLSELNVKGCTNLKKLECEMNMLTSLDLTNCNKLEYLSCEDNRIKNLNLGRNSHLSIIECAYNDLSSLDVSKCNRITTIVCDYNKLKRIKFGTNPLLSVLMCSANKLSSLDIGGCSMLKNTVTPIIASSEHARDRSYDVVIWGDYWDSYGDDNPDMCYMEIDPGTTLKSGKTILYKPGSPKSIKFTRSSGTLKKGKYINLGKYIKMNPTGVASVCKLSSSNKKVVMVDNSGYAYGLKKGTATITVKTANGKKAKIRITVK